MFRQSTVGSDERRFSRVIEPGSRKNRRLDRTEISQSGVTRTVYP